MNERESKCNDFYYRKGIWAVKQSVGTFTHRYSVVHGQTHSAVQKSKHSSKKLVDIREIVADDRIFRRANS